MREKGLKMFNPTQEKEKEKETSTPQAQPLDLMSMPIPILPGLPLPSTPRRLPINYQSSPVTPYSYHLSFPGIPQRSPLFEENQNIEDFLMHVSQITPSIYRSMPPEDVKTLMKYMILRGDSPLSRDGFDFMTDDKKYFIFNNGTGRWLSFIGLDTNMKKLKKCKITTMDMIYHS